MIDINILHNKYLNWRLRKLGYDTESHRNTIYIFLHKKYIHDIKAKDFKNIFRRFLIKYFWLYKNAKGEYVVRIE